MRCDKFETISQRLEKLVSIADVKVRAVVLDAISSTVKQLQDKKAKQHTPILRMKSIDLTAKAEANSKPVRSLFSLLRPSATHSAFSATILLMLSTFLSGVLGLVRTKYINYIFGAGPQTDAYNAAFQLPDMLAYFLVGGVASISLVTILNRFSAQGDEDGADKALSIVLNAMIVVLGAGIVLAEIFAPLYTRIAFRGFGPEQAALCTSLTRLLLPAQLFFFIGGVIGSRLLVRKIFLYQALTPLIYNLGIILGAVFLHQRFGIYSLAIGVLAGVIVGPAVLNAAGAFRDGLRYHPILNLRHPAFIEWLRLTFPLMIGVSLVTADKWILAYFASNDSGGISRLTVAKTLFNAPMGILGQAAGAASLPFFSALFSQHRFDDFASAVNRSVSRVLAASFMLAAWMIALAGPIVDLFRAAHSHLRMHNRQRFTSPSSPSRSPSGRHRESMRAPSIQRGTPSLRQRQVGLSP